VQLLLIAALILIAIVFAAKISSKMNVPLIVIALAIGIIFGSDITGLIYFDDAVLTQRIADIALVFILFAGGFGTKNYNLRPVIKPTLLLATLGVLITALITALPFAYITGWPILSSMLLCAIISSTDAAAVFSILSNYSINKNIRSITEIESAANDPMAIISTTLVLQIILGKNFNHISAVLSFFWQLSGGIMIGIAVGLAGSYLFKKIKDLDIGYLYLLLLGVILLSYSFASVVGASGMLSAFFAGYIMGNSKLPYKTGISSFTNILSFISGAGLFILLGLLVFPKKFPEVWTLGLLLFILLTFIGRPAAVFICTMFTKLNYKEKLFLSWSGFRGAVPIVLATYPFAAGIDENHVFFNIVFFAVALSMIIQGTTIGKLAKKFRLISKHRKRSGQMMELVTVHETDYELIEIYIDPDIYGGECMVFEMSLPFGTTITMLNRNNFIVAPSGKTTVIPGDILSVLVKKNKIEYVTEIILGKFSKK
jgi:potassium/hydrogen antiporter